jgi:peptidoglycan/xylan/chitin deacetylase (PgdA/CDA1 family)
MKRYNLPAVIYVVAGAVNTNRHFWFTAAGSELTELKKVQNDERHRRLKEHFNHEDEREYGTRQALSLSEVQQFLAVGGTVGSHSLHHPILNKCEDEVILNECAESRRITEAMTGRPVLHFAYPGGIWDNRIKELIKRSGYTTARTIDPGWVTAVTDPLALPNFAVSDDADVSKAIVQASGLWGMIKSVLRLPQ